MSTAEIHNDNEGAEDAPETEGPRSFAVFLRQLSMGECESRSSYEMHELVKRLQEEAKTQHRKVKGTLTLTISLVADVNETVNVFYEVKTKTPKPITTPAIFWMTKNGNLSASDTRQLELKPRAVPAQAKETRTAPARQPPKEV